MRGNSHVRCEAGEKSETLETVDLPIAMRADATKNGIFRNVVSIADKKAIPQGVGVSLSETADRVICLFGCMRKCSVHLSIQR